tara:strand:+ start:835 stop:1203 length:369 start_codon:yes stop_codon:yes gene_type:complete
MEATAWKINTDDSGMCTYQMQIEKIKGKRELNQVNKLVSDWETFAEGYNSTNKTALLVLRRSFSNLSSWINWARQFPYNLEELNNKGNPKPIKLGLASQSRRRRGVKSNDNRKKAKKRCSQA